MGRSHILDQVEDTEGDPGPAPGAPEPARTPHPQEQRPGQTVQGEQDKGERSRAWGVRLPKLSPIRPLLRAPRRPPHRLPCARSSPPNPPLPSLCGAFRNAGPSCPFPAYSQPAPTPAPHRIHGTQERSLTRSESGPWLSVQPHFQHCPLVPCSTCAALPRTCCPLFPPSRMLGWPGGAYLSLSPASWANAPVSSPFLDHLSLPCTGLNGCGLLSTCQPHSRPPSVAPAGRSTWLPAGIQQVSFNWVDVSNT